MPITASNFIDLANSGFYNGLQAFPQVETGEPVVDSHYPCSRAEAPRGCYDLIYNFLWFGDWRYYNMRDFPGGPVAWCDVSGTRTTPTRAPCAA